MKSNCASLRPPPSKSSEATSDRQRGESSVTTDSIQIRGQKRRKVSHAHTHTVGHFWHLLHLLACMASPKFRRSSGFLSALVAAEQLCQNPEGWLKPKRGPAPFCHFSQAPALARVPISAFSLWLAIGHKRTKIIPAPASCRCCCCCKTLQKLLRLERLPRSVAVLSTIPTRPSPLRHSSVCFIDASISFRSPPSPLTCSVSLVRLVSLTIVYWSAFQSDPLLHRDREALIAYAYNHFYPHILAQTRDST